MTTPALLALHHVQRAMPPGGEPQARAFQGALPGMDRLYLDDPFGNRLDLLEITG